MEYTKDDIVRFADKLLEACQARDKSVAITIDYTPLKREYVVTLYSHGNRPEQYAFNPNTGDWIVCYSV